MITFFGLIINFINSKSISVKIECVLPVFLFLVELSNIDVTINIFWITFDCLFVTFNSFFFLSIIIVGTCKIEMTFWTVVVKFYSNFVRVNCLIQLIVSMMSVSQVVERRIVHRIKSNCFQVKFNSFRIIIFVTIRISEVVKAFNFFRV